MRKIFNKLRSMPKRYAVLTAALLAAVIVPAALNAWGPSDRATFTWDKPAYACLATRIPTGEEITKEY